MKETIKIFKIINFIVKLLINSYENEYVCYYTRKYQKIIMQKLRVFFVIKQSDLDAEFRIYAYLINRNTVLSAEYF